MIRRRTRPDGLPFNVYERRGVRVYSIGYKRVDGSWAFRLSCPIGDVAKVRETRAEAVRQAAAIERGAPDLDSFDALADAWFARQRAMPDGTPGRRAERTLEENEREARNLRRAFGPMLVAEIQRADAYGYQDAAQRSKRRRNAKANKELALAHTILEYGVRLGKLSANPFTRIEKLPTVQHDRHVTDDELQLAIEVGRRMGGPQHICALALKTAWLCVKRSVEVRQLRTEHLQDDGIVWTGAKRKAGQAPRRVLILWSPALRATIDEALAIKRNEMAGTANVFGNLSGEQYTKGGWKATLAKLMAECKLEAAKRGVEFQPFSLQDCRPKGVSDKLEQGHEDTIDATLHTSERMVRQVYDRRRTRVAKPVK
jgi:integrase